MSVPPSSASTFDNLHLSFIKPPSMCHSPHISGMQLTRCMSLDCSSASLILGSSFTRSRLRNAWTTYSAPWVRKVCSYGLLGPNWWSPQMRSREIPQLSWEHLGWWALLLSLSIWAWGYQEEVWQINWWTHRQDMPTHLPCADRWW